MRPTPALSLLASARSAVGLTAFLAVLVFSAFSAGCRSAPTPIPDDTTVLPVYRSAALTPEWPRATPEPSDGVAFALTNQDGETITEQTLHGHIYVASFFFVRCSSICPTLRTNLTDVQDAYRDADDVLIVSHTVDPESDTADVLAGYAQVNGVERGKWHLLTGQQDVIFDLARDRYFTDLKALGDGYVHSENLFLVDAEGQIRGVYNGTLPFEIDQLIADIATLRSTSSS